MSDNSSSMSVLLKLPAPQSLDDHSVPNVPIGAEAPVKLDKLGPMLVNSDGTLSRIANWENMTEGERERTMRVVVARNRTRLAKQRDNTESPSNLFSGAA
ncbi:hypothetical protein PAXRUDRAFT_826754 [Paxillus rubicundulus Ve08.2h10]|uniref:Uncharacterized protein n=1 Tax=Paxillus rubicundulus Ve08.2h10 TaxID=930991 RepID=A0A0D0E9E0_9AGAM|nr:hypothetical protein PAXRUDRAFT_826754 [Paxillus rubicundulus Ve08.2h10]